MAKKNIVDKPLTMNIVDKPLTIDIVDKPLTMNIIDKPFTIFKCINKNFVGGIDQGVQEEKNELDDLPILCGSLNLNPQKKSTTINFGKFDRGAEVDQNYFTRADEAKIGHNYFDKEANDSINKNYYEETTNLSNLVDVAGKGHSLDALGNLVDLDTGMALNPVHYNKGAIPKRTHRIPRKENIDQNYFARTAEVKICQNYFDKEAKEERDKNYFDETECFEVATNETYSLANSSVRPDQSNENAEANLFGHYTHTSGKSHSLNALGNLVGHDTDMSLNPVHYNMGAIPKQTRCVPSREDNFGERNAKLSNIYMPKDSDNPENENTKWIRMEVFNLQPSVKKSELKNMIMLQVDYPVMVEVISIQKVNRGGNFSKSAVVEVLGYAAAQMVAKCIAQYKVDEKYYEVRFL